MRGYRRGSAVLTIVVLSAGCQTIEPHAHHMYTQLMAKNTDLFDKDVVRRVLPASPEAVEKAVFRTFSEQHALVDGADLDFALPPDDRNKKDPELQTSAHVDVVRKEFTKKNGTKVATIVLSNWYRLVAVRIEHAENGCEVTTRIYAEKSGNAQRASALLVRISENLAIAGGQEASRAASKAEAGPAGDHVQ